jgi:hypothetical protein
MAVIGYCIGYNSLDLDATRIDFSALHRVLGRFLKTLPVRLMDGCKIAHAALVISRSHRHSHYDIGYIAAAFAEVRDTLRPCCFVALTSAPVYTRTVCELV